MALKIKGNFQANGITGEAGKELTPEQLQKIQPLVEDLKKEGLIEEVQSEKDEKPAIETLPPTLHTDLKPLDETPEQTDFIKESQKKKK